MKSKEEMQRSYGHKKNVLKKDHGERKAFKASNDSPGSIFSPGNAGG